MKQSSQKWILTIQRQFQKESGFTLIEVMAAIVILSVVIMMAMTYFSSSLSYNKINENKTVMINLARNALVYAEKQEFAAWNTYFIEGNHTQVTGASCTSGSTCSPYQFLVANSSPEILSNVLNPNINGVQYTVTIQYEASSATGIQADTNYLLPIRVSVQGPEQSNARNGTSVEGYITNEKIR